VFLLTVEAKQKRRAARVLAAERAKVARQNDAATVAMFLEGVRVRRGVVVGAKHLRGPPLLAVVAHDVSFESIERDQLLSALDAIQRRDIHGGGHGDGVFRVVGHPATA